MRRGDHSDKMAERYRIGNEPATPGMYTNFPSSIHGYNQRAAPAGGFMNSPPSWQRQSQMQQSRYAGGYSGVGSPSSYSPAAHSTQVKQYGTGELLGRTEQTGGYVPGVGNPSSYSPATHLNQTKQRGNGDMVGRAEQAARIAYNESLSAGESVSCWKITQAMLSILKADSLDSLGLRIQDIPCLYKIILLEGKLNAFVHCYVAVRRIATLHDLCIEICRHEGVEDFERLGLGPLIRHPLVVHYFAPPPDALTIFIITTEQIISYLSDFMDMTQEKEIQVEEFLSFVAKKEFVSFPEQLCIRVQSLRMHTGFLRRIKKMEKDLVREKEAEIEKMREIERNKRRFDMQSQIISDRVNSFLSIDKNIAALDYGPKHIRFETDSSSDDDDDVVAEKTRISSAKKRKFDYECEKILGSCPYPSAAEEWARLGKQQLTEKFKDKDRDLADEKSENISVKKRKLNGETKKSLDSHPYTPEVGQQLSTEKFALQAEEVVLADNDLKEFVAAWKDICRDHSVFEVLKRMMKVHMPTDKKRKKNYRKFARKQFARKQSRIFTMQPAIGLLNVAVMSMKIGLWDSLYDTFQEVNKHEYIETKTAHVSGVIDVGPSKARAQVPSIKEENLPSVTENGLGIDEVLQHLIRFFELKSIDKAPAGDSKMNELFAILRMVWDSEKWLVKQFSVTDFACLGFGDYLEFLEKQLSRLPERIMRILTVHKYRNSPVAAYIAEHQMLLFLSQAAWELNDDTTMTIEEIAVLLYKQFPLISFELSDSLSVQEIVDFIRKYKGFCPQRNTMYSAALLSRSNSSDSSMLTPNILGSPQKWMFECRQNAGSFGHMTSVDAVRCLLKAPMLSDLDEWSHWDRVFAPSLGPLLNFLEKEQNTSDLLCLVTRSGKVIRIDSLASMDAFLAAAVKGSGKETAVQLVSIVSLYGGTHHAPVALMKSHACRAIEVLVKNSMDCYQLTEFTLSDNCPKARLGERKFCIESDHTAVPWKSVHFEDIVHKENTESFQNVKRTTWAIRVAARFILDCLFCLPSEFRTFAADILLSGLSLLSEGASQIILCECVTNDQRLMLHEIGLCIGIVDWINDYRSFYLDASHVHPSTESHEGKSNAENNVQSCIEGKSRINRLEGIHSPDKKMFEKKEAPLVVSNQKMQFEDLSDQKRLQTNHKECDKYMPSCEGFDGDTNNNEEEDAKSVIEAIRREEFGLDSKLHNKESDLLKKQHARLGRALHCLSQELYSQDSHFLLELVQNADDNLYPQGVEPALAFILQSTGVVVLNNELGFTSQNIRALCDVGNSTKKGSSAGYIGQKGIGFKSVFRVTDVPEIHSKGFHIKFDISEGKLGFILPTLVPPRYDIDSLHKELATENDKGENSVWNTCIVLPFKSSVVEGTGMRSWASKFADLHPSLLLFLHRLRCIKVRNSLTNSLKIMRREDIGNGLVKVSHGIESTTWLVTSQKLNAGITRLGVQTTEIALAFTLSEDPSGEYGPYLEQQPVFAFLPLRAYGLKFILQGDFILPSSREEVDGDSAWNQWLLSEFPELFVSAAESFKALPCFCSNPGKAVTLYMSFVPLVGEVLGFFSPLPRMIISRLRASQCLPLDGKDKQWVLPCMALRGWSDQIRMLLPDDLLNNHLGLGYLHRDVALSDPLATVLGVHTFGAGTLIEIMKSICKRRDAIKNLGLEWIGSWLVALYDCLNVRPTATQSSVHVKPEPDSLSALGQIPFIPLSDGSYTSLVEGSIWIPCEATEAGNEGAHILKNFPNLYCELRTVDPSLFFSGAVASDAMIRGDSDIIMRMLRHVGVGQLSAHEVVMTHILPALSDVECMTKNKLLVTEYLAFIMQHLQSNCSACIVDRPKLILQLQKKAVIMTNNGYKRAGSEPLHFSKEFGNPTDMSKLLAGTNVTWNEIDSVYLKFSCNDVQLLNLSQWRNFFGELGVTDFVQVLDVEKKVNDQSCSIWKDVPWDSNPNSVGWIVKDWESPELVEILTALSSSRESVKQCSYLLEILDTLWDDLYGTKECVYWCGNPDGKVGKHTQTSCVLKMHAFQWVKSTLDGRLHLPTDLFFDCDDVKCILGPHAPYATPQVHSKKFVADIGFRTHVLAKDALDLLHVWSKTENVFKASTAQMGRLYSFLWTRMATCREEIVSHFRKESCIFVPFVDESNQEELVPGMFVSLEQVYWRDPTGCLDLLKKTAESSIKLTVTEHSYCRALYQIYPNLYSFFVNECHVLESPNFDGYVNILQHLSRIARPSQVSSEVMQVLIKWAEDVESERVDCKEISRWKECLCELENAVLPTMQDKWVSLHPNFGLVCWCDDLELEKQFKHSNGVCFLLLNLDGNTKRVKKVPSKLITFLHAMGIPPLSEVVMREAIFYGVQDSRQTTSLINWILPYAQRYVYKMHPEVYSVLKDTSFNNLLNQLRLLVVEKLFYRHTLKGCHSVSNERNECSCLLQGSNLYVSRMADFSAIYLEFSRVFFNGCVNLQLANFLHLITIMAETGAAEEQTQSFILNTQNIPRLPLEEANWFLEYREEQIDSCPVPSNPSPSENNLMTKKPPKLRADACWPPTTWISAPKSRDDFKHVAKEVGWAANSSINQYLARNDYNSDKEKIHVSSSSGNSACESDWIIGDFSASVLAAVPHDAKAEHDKHTGEIEFNGESAINGKSNAFLEASLTGVGNNNIISQSQELSDTNIGASLFNMRDQLFVGVPDDEQRQLTGRLGELIVYKYLIEKYGPASVNWVNEKEETGLAFDIIVSKEDGKEEYIEVKATRSQNKDWFEITNREWDFASKNSDCFTIIRVFLASPQYAKFVLLANPIKLCQQKLIKLAILMPAHPYSALPEVSIIPQAVGIDGGF